jgi:hypothetical protein
MYFLCMPMTPHERRQSASTLRKWIDRLSDQDPRHALVLSLAFSVLCMVALVLGITYVLYRIWP